MAQVPIGEGAGVIAAGLWGMLAAASLLLGAVVAMTVKVPRRVVGHVMGFGSGALLAALSYELIPAVHVADWQIWVSFASGALVFFLLDGALERQSASGAGAGVSIALGTLLDGVPESIVLGVGVAVGGAVSVGFLVAVLVSNIPESLAATVDLRTTHSALWIYRLWGGIVVCSGLAAALGYLVAVHVSSVDGRDIQRLLPGLY